VIICSSKLKPYIGVRYACLARSEVSTKLAEKYCAWGRVTRVAADGHMTALSVAWRPPTGDALIRAMELLRATGKSQVCSVGKRVAFILDTGALD
jgi:hypothetical protein